MAEGQDCQRVLEATELALAFAIQSNKALSIDLNAEPETHTSIVTTILLWQGSAAAYKLQPVVPLPLVETYQVVENKALSLSSANANYLQQLFVWEAKRLS
ncbi:hypothetical protein JHK84_030744 [Glycine max]|nr:hypothetical protein JHK84_030744 [Glycine max]